MYDLKGPLYELNLNNIRVTCNAWAYEQTQKEKYLIFASLIGPATLLKGVRGTLDTNNTNRMANMTPIRWNEAWEVIQGHESIYFLKTEFLKNFRRVMTQIQDLDPIQSNLIIWPHEPEEEDPIRTQYTLARSENELPTMYLQNLLKNTNVMARPQWAETIYQFALDNELVHPLVSHNVFGCSNRFIEEKMIMDFISTELKNGTLPIEAPQKN